MARVPRACAISEIVWLALWYMLRATATDGPRRGGRNGGSAPPALLSISGFFPVPADFGIQVGNPAVHDTHVGASREGANFWYS